MKQKIIIPMEGQAYGDLAWIDTVLDSAQMYATETETIVKIIQDYDKNVKTMLHLGCGSGNSDYTFKKYFRVTGVDISSDMLEIARTQNPEVIYHQGDMKKIRLKKKFDSVVIPDSIGYMTTLEDLKKALVTAYEHLKPGGILFVMALLSEDFKENNFVYTGSKGDVEVTIFENNYIHNIVKYTYESTMIYLLRQKGQLEIYTDTHLLGLFPKGSWLELFKDVGFIKIEEKSTNDLYDDYLLGKGEYLLELFLATKP